MKWLLVGLAILLLLLGAGLFAARHWIGTEDFRARVQQEASAALGVPLLLKSMDVTLWPLPAVTLQAVELLTKPALTVGRLDVRPDWQALSQRELRVSALLVHDATLPQAGLDALLAAMNSSRVSKEKSGPATPVPADAGLMLPSWLPRKTLLRGVTWVSPKGNSSTLDGEVELGQDGLPEQLTVTLTRGPLKDTRARLQRLAPQQSGDEAGWPSWGVNLQLAGGTVKGRLSAQIPGVGGAGLTAPASVTPWAVSGQFEARDIEIAALTAPARPLSGKLEASTRMQGRSASAAALTSALETQTTFTVRKAVLHGLDLARAVQTVGLSRGGETALNTLAGQVATRGAAIQLSNLVASSGVLSATGNINVSPARALSGRVNVDLAGGAVGVPLLVGGTLDAPSVTLTRGALVGAAIGTVLMPGVGTGAGAKLGDRIGDGLKGLFGNRK